VQLVISTTVIDCFGMAKRKVIVILNQAIYFSKKMRMIGAYEEVELLR